jgi:hypothetical protein
MGLAHSPNINIGGLLMMIDPRNSKCYSGSGSNFTDMITGRTGTLYGVDAAINQDFSMPRTDDGAEHRAVISSGYGGTSLTTYSFIIWQKIRSATQFGSRWFGLDSYGTYTIFNPPNVGFHYNPGNSASSSVTIWSGYDAPYGTWFQLGVTVNHSTPLVRIGINGSWRNSSTIHPSSGFNGNINLGAQRTSSVQQPSDCEISHFSLYNKEITEQEFKQNYEVFRARFGI